MIDIEVPFVCLMLEDVQGNQRVYMRSMVIQGLMNIFYLTILVWSLILDVFIEKGKSSLLVADKDNPFQLKRENGYFTIWILVNFYLGINEMILSFYLRRKLTRSNY